jgi:hypothetical protein
MGSRKRAALCLSLWSALAWAGGGSTPHIHCDSKKLGLALGFDGPLRANALTKGLKIGVTGEGRTVTYEVALFEDKPEVTTLRLEPVKGQKDFGDLELHFREGPDGEGRFDRDVDITVTKAGSPPRTAPIVCWVN